MKSYQSGTSSLRSSSSGFESARTEAVDILDNLSDVVRKEINNIDYKLESFNKDVLRQLKEHTETYKKRVVWIID